MFSDVIDTPFDLRRKVLALALNVSSLEPMDDRILDKTNARMMGARDCYEFDKPVGKCHRLAWGMSIG
jgi:hypothetical protein